MSAQSVEIRRLLLEHPFVKDFDAAHLDQLAACAWLDTFHAGEYLFRAGETADRCYLVRDGLVALDLYDPSRGPVTLETVGPDKAIGWSWLIPPYRWCYDGRAQTLTRAIAVNAEGLRRALEEDYRLGYFVLRKFTEVFADRLHASRLRLLDMYGPAARRSGKAP